MSKLDVKWARAQFPALAQEVGGKPAVFLDGPGGTQVPQAVIDAISGYLQRSNSNAGGAFATSARTDATIAAARAAMADLLGCRSEEVVFGANMTTLAFSLSHSLGRDWQKGDEVLVTHLDHDANYTPWRALEERGAVIRTVDIHTGDCTLDLEDLDRKLGPRTRFVAVPLASNAVGSIVDVAEVTRRAHRVGAQVFVDAVHYAPHGPIDVRAIDCDFLACSPYKFFGPHLGVLYGKRTLLRTMRPYKLRPSSDLVPERWETGTQNHEALAGLTAAVEYLAALGRRSSPGTGDRSRALAVAMDAIRDHERELARRMASGLQEIPGLKLYGISDPDRFEERVPTFAVRIDGRSPQELANALGKEGIFAWHGNYYALPLTERLGVEDSGGMLRLGLVHYNTAEEIDRALDVLSGLS